MIEYEHIKVEFFNKLSIYYLQDVEVSEGKIKKKQ